MASTCTDGVRARRAGPARMTTTTATMQYKAVNSQEYRTESAPENMGAKKAGPTAPTEAWYNMAISTLPFVLLNSQVNRI
jgi:hypothetical protein